MPLDVLHPLYEKISPDWKILRDVYEGERVIKLAAQTYLPATAGMILDGMGATQLGYSTYLNYKMRAVWHDHFKDAIEAYLGMLHNKDAQIQLPSGMVNIRSNHGETPLEFLRRINEEQLISGRLGILVDLPEPSITNQASPLPYLTFYAAEAVRNWDDRPVGNATQTFLQWVILDESDLALDAYSWSQRTKYRVCQMDTTGNYTTGVYTVLGGGVPNYDEANQMTPTIRGTPLKYIPFTFLNSADLLSTPYKAPLLGLANMMLGIYRGEADYRYNLFMQGQDTLVIIGGRQQKTAELATENQPIRTGAGSWIEIEQDGDAKYIGVDSSGLPEQRQALDALLKQAETRAGHLVNARAGDKESGEALRTRVGAQTATLRQIALSGAAALERSLKSAASWMGLNPEEVKIVPNLEFGEFTLTGQDMFQMTQAKDSGLPLSYKSMHEYLARRGATTRSFDDEMAEIKSETALRTTLRLPEPPKQAPGGGSA